MWVVDWLILHYVDILKAILITLLIGSIAIFALLVMLSWPPWKKKKAYIKLCMVDECQEIADDWIPIVHRIKGRFSSYINFWFCKKHRLMLHENLDMAFNKWLFSTITQGSYDTDLGFKLKSDIYNLYCKETNHAVQREEKRQEG